MENEWQLGRWWRVPLAMHWTVLLMLPWMFLWYRDVAITVGAFTGYFLVLLAHEFGHVWMARRLRIPVEGILLVGIHGQTSHGYANRADDLKIAWSGVGSQLLILLAAWLTTPLVLRLQLPLLDRFVGGLWLGFTDINLFLVVAALLPIGPFDGHRAWQVIPYWRDRFRRRRRGRGDFEKVVKLDPAKRRELQKKSEKLTAEILEGLGKKGPGGNNKKLH